MFKKILIANRGEIACRIIKTARNMGIHSVAIYSTVDKNSLHVTQADSAFCVGEGNVKTSYLNIQTIIDAAKLSGAQAIHPGYGFLAENPQLAKACDEAEITFIGPTIYAMEAMASKQKAKQLLEKTDVPLIPGYHGNKQTDENLLLEARRVGFPLLLKAASGGGGKGMRIVNKETDFFQALAGSRREAMAFFADDTLIIEKLLINPRHVEVQVMADNQGQIVHLFTRDCSIQRRHQKIIEEAPAPNLPTSLQQNLAKAACEVARSIDYRGAGTVEFLVDDHKHFYFMEMNTRLQVEHAVTEMITGLDLVAWQLKIAANKPLPCRQNEILALGHAIECRIYAEDPQQEFIPSTGQVRFLKEPVGEGIRVDSGVSENSLVTKYYDPMIAKLIAWGQTREEALQRLQQALGHYVIGGIKTNIPFLQTICNHSQFAKAHLGTDFLTQAKISFVLPDKHWALLMAASYDYLALRKNNLDPLANSCFAWQMMLPSHWHWRYLLEGQEEEVKISPVSGDCFKLQSHNQEMVLHTYFKAEQLVVHDGKQTQQAWVENQPQQLSIYSPQGVTSIKRFDWQNVSMQTIVKKNQLTAPMPATVVAILKNKGDKVKEGDSLIVLEAMKMEHTIHAPKDGVLTELFYEVGSQVSEGAELLALED